MYKYIVLRPTLYFNPRPREEGDICSFMYCLTTPVISIHALVKRATPFQRFVKFNVTYFNPRPREEGDLLSFPLPLALHDFNPRPREEGDHLYVLIGSLFFNFNPRPREEGD